MTTDHRAQRAPRDDSEVFRAVLIEDARKRAGDHPAIDTLVDYLTDVLEPEADEKVLDHLAACRECVTVVLDLEPLVTPDAAPEGVADLELEAAWRDLQARIKAPNRLEDSGPGSRPLRAPRWTAALAASLLLAVVGLSSWVYLLQRSSVGLRHQVARLSRPQVNPPIVYLDEITRSEPAGAVAELASDQPFVLLIVIPGTPEVFSSYEALLTDDQGGIVWRGAGLELSEEGTLRMRLPRELLPAGDYRVQIQGVGGDPTGELREIVIDTSLRVVYK